jgi:hypothetical protein
MRCVGKQSPSGRAIADLSKSDCIVTKYCPERQPEQNRVALKTGIALKGQRHTAQGWPRFLRPTLGNGAIIHNPEGVVVLIPHIAFIPFQSMLFKHLAEFILKRDFPVMLFLSSDVLSHDIEIHGTD